MLSTREAGGDSCPPAAQALHSAIQYKKKTKEKKSRVQLLQTVSLSSGRL